MAARVILPTAHRSLSTVHKGLAFEKRAQAVLRSISMSLEHVGGRDDGGVDLQGYWWLPHPDDPAATLRLRVLAQCKAEVKKMGPSYVREMEGVLAHQERQHRHDHQEQQQQDVVALLVSQSQFTKATLLRALSSHFPFFLLHLPPEPVSNTSPGADSPTELAPDADTDADTDTDIDTELGLPGSAVWNTALSGSNGLLKSAFDLRWERHLLLRSGNPALWLGRHRVTPRIPPEFDVSLAQHQQ